MQLLLPLQINPGDRVLAYGKEVCIYEGISNECPSLHVVKLIRTGRDRKGKVLYTKWTLALHNIQPCLNCWGDEINGKTIQEQIACLGQSPAKSS